MSVNKNKREFVRCLGGSFDKIENTSVPLTTDTHVPLLPHFSGTLRKNPSRRFESTPSLRDGSPKRWLTEGAGGPLIGRYEAPATLKTLRQWPPRPVPVPVSNGNVLRLQMKGKSKFHMPTSTRLYYICAWRWRGRPAIIRPPPPPWRR